MPLAAGAAAAVLWRLLGTEFLPASLAFVVALAPGLTSALLVSARPRFAPPRILDEALLLVLVFGVVVAVLPGFSEGWRAALALNAESTSNPRAALPLWTMATSAGVMVLGGGYSLWRYR